MKKCMEEKLSSWPFFPTFPTWNSWPRDPPNPPELPKSPYSDHPFDLRYLSHPLPTLYIFTLDPHDPQNLLTKLSNWLTTCCLDQTWPMWFILPIWHTDVAHLLPRGSFRPFWPTFPLFFFCPSESDGGRDSMRVMEWEKGRYIKSVQMKNLRKKSEKS